ncbi:multicopper oxidase family protein [Kitasatospora sp. NPDC018058]|uniref:multicopper oxidase family protein n=1 Tax=Kitasatospora sp. NPDC018058 TaxID=3364025 RepID=UPI0037C0124D
MSATTQSRRFRYPGILGHPARRRPRLRPGAWPDALRQPGLGHRARGYRYAGVAASAEAPQSSRKPGSRVRLRLINAGADTAFLVALGDHRMQVVQTDGTPVEPVEADCVLLGMGERYDVIITLKDGVFPLVALAEGKSDNAFAVVRTSSGSTPPPTTRPAQLTGTVVGGRNVASLTAAQGHRLTARTVDQDIPIALTGSMAGYQWSLDQLAYNPKVPLAVMTSGQRVRLSYTNTTMMWHPMHFHGHSFAVGGPNGPRKDTVMVLPGQTVTCEFDTDNPGQWVTHCHNAYHEEAGMIGVLAYRA